MLKTILGCSTIDSRYRQSLIQDTSGPTTREVDRFASRFFALGLILSSGTMLSFATLNVVAWPMSILVAFSSLLCALGILKYHQRNEQSKNLYHLKKLRDEALKMELSEIIQLHGWEKLLKLQILTAEQFHRKYYQYVNGKNLTQIMDFYEKTIRHLDVNNCSKNYSIPQVSEFAHKWRPETRDLSFEEIIERYSIDRLEKYALIAPAELHLIKQLKKDYDIFKNYYNEKKSNLEKEYNQFMIEPNRQYQEEQERIENIYRSAQAVRELQGLAMNYARQRELVHQSQNRAKQEARNRFREAIASYTNSGRILYAQLSDEYRSRYDMEEQTRQREEEEADNIAKIQINRINEELQQRTIQLNAEELRARQEKESQLEEAKKQHEIRVKEFTDRIKLAMRPIERFTASSILDLNGRYRAQLYRNDFKNRFSTSL